MLTTRVIPCLDIKDGRVVKGTRFRDLRDSGDPVELAVRYQEQGADELAVLDIGATPGGRGHALDCTRAIRRKLSIPLTVGGGLRSVEDAAAFLTAGADKVAVNSAAVARPGLINELSARFGAQCTVLSIDAVRAGTGWTVKTHSGSRDIALAAEDWAREAAKRGAGEILLTSFDRDGVRTGYDLELIRAVVNAARIPVIASGGAGEPRHLAEAVSSGASAVLAASLFHEGLWTVSGLKKELQEFGLRMRT